MTERHTRIDAGEPSVAWLQRVAEEHGVYVHGDAPEPTYHVDVERVLTPESLAASPGVSAEPLDTDRVLAAATRRYEWVVEQMDDAYDRDAMPEFKRWDDQRIQLSKFIDYLELRRRFRGGNDG